MKVTEKSLKARCTELNLGPLRNTTFGIKATRLNAGYTPRWSHLLLKVIRDNSDFFAMKPLRSD